MPKSEVIHGCCLDHLPKMAACSVDSIVTDPPYEIGIVGKDWDAAGVAYAPGVWIECLRALKPGGHLLAFGGTRTYHRLAAAIEDVGFEIRDSVAWLYGSGFPKSHNIGKAMDKLEGRTRQVIGKTNNMEFTAGGSMAGNTEYEYQRVELERTRGDGDYEGWGTALKPAMELLVMARKPISERTVALNIKRWGTGALNIDATRVPYGDEPNPHVARIESAHRAKARGKPEGGGGKRSNVATLGKWGNMANCKLTKSDYIGRWPANVAHDGYDEATEAMPITQQEIGAEFECEQWDNLPGGNAGKVKRTKTGKQQKQSAKRYFKQAEFSDPEAAEQGRWPANVAHDGSDEATEAMPDVMAHTEPRHVTEGKWQGNPGGNAEPHKKSSAPSARQSASRYFYCAKASRAEREAGLDAISHSPHNQLSWNDIKRRNSHPAVKPIELMRWLCRMITPAGGTVLDPFAGSGTTLIAAYLENFNSIGVEQSAEYAQIAEQRLKYWKCDLT